MPLMFFNEKYFRLVNAFSGWLSLNPRMGTFPTRGTVPTKKK